MSNLLLSDVFFQALNAQKLCFRWVSAPDSAGRANDAPQTPQSAAEGHTASPYPSPRRLWWPDLGANGAAILIGPCKPNSWLRLCESREESSALRSFWIFRSRNGVLLWTLRQKMEGQNEYFWKVGAMAHCPRRVPRPLKISSSNYCPSDESTALMMLLLLLIMMVKTPKNSISHWNRSSPLQQCRHYRAALWLLNFVMNIFLFMLL